MAGIPVQNTEPAGMGSDVDQILRFIYMYGFYVIGSEAVFLCIMCEFLRLRVVIVQTAVIGTYPDTFLCVFFDTAYGIAV